MLHFILAFCTSTPRQVDKVPHSLYHLSEPPSSEAWHLSNINTERKCMWQLRALTLKSRESWV